jgi:hypothetical protein
VSKLRSIAELRAFYGIIFRKTVKHDLLRFEWLRGP